MASTLWLEERDMPVWHRTVARIGPLDYRAACGRELTAREGRVWAQKPNDPGPAAETRCLACVAAAAT